MSRTLDEREKALNVSRAGFQQGTIARTSIEFGDGWTNCEVLLRMNEGDKTLKLEVPYEDLKNFCGGDNFGNIVGAQVWYADKQITSEKPSGLMNINIVERKK